MHPSQIIERALVGQHKLKKRTYDAIGTLYNSQFYLCPMWRGSRRLILSNCWYIRAWPVAEYPKLEPLFVDLAKFIDARSGQTAEAHANGDGSSPKKRKIDASEGTEVHGKSFLHEDWNTKTFSSITDLSFSIPQRKKLTLEIGTLKTQGVRARNPSTGAVEFGVSYQDIRKHPHVLNSNRTLISACFQSMSSASRCPINPKDNTTFACFPYTVTVSQLLLRKHQQ